MRKQNLWSVVTLMALFGFLATSAYAGDKPAAIYGAGAHQFSLATDSPGELGLLKVLAETGGRTPGAAEIPEDRK